jgi:hypothetical protein
VFSLGYCVLKQHKSWFDEGCPELLDERTQAKLQCLQALSQLNGNALNNVRSEAGRRFRNKKATHRKNKNIRDLYGEIAEFKNGYQPRTNMVKDDNNDLPTDSNNILNR